MKASLSGVYHLRRNILYRVTGERLTIIDINDLENKCYELDGISRFVFLKIDGQSSLAEIVSVVARELTLSEEYTHRLADDSLAFFSLLLERDWVTV